MSGSCTYRDSEIRKPGKPSVLPITEGFELYAVFGITLIVFMRIKAELKEKCTMRRVSLCLGSKGFESLMYLQGCRTTHSNYATKEVSKMEVKKETKPQAFFENLCSGAPE